MKYTQYLAALLGAQGAPQLTVEQFKTVMNLVHLEGRIAQLEALRKKASKTSEPRRYDIELRTQEERRSQITREAEPKEFFAVILREQAWNE